MTKTMQIVAVTNIGAEYAYRPWTVHRVSRENASRICEAINAARYKLDDGEVWKVYKVSEIDVAYAVGKQQAFTIRGGKLYET